MVVALGVIRLHRTLPGRQIQGDPATAQSKRDVFDAYINFSHFRRRIYPAYNNIQSIPDMIKAILDAFQLAQVFPVSHHWRHKQSGKNALPRIQMHFDIDIPGISPWLAVEYFFTCKFR